MSTVMDTVFPVVNPASGSASDTAPAPASDTPSGIREGDWQAYQERIAERHHIRFDDAAALLAYERQCAFFYLGKRAQKHGGVYSKKPRILAPEVIARLEENNRAKRYARYPWIEKLLKLMAEIERLQEESAGAQNVFSLVQPTRIN